MKIDESFLTVDPAGWSEHPSYIHGKDFISQLKVVNDCAERMIKLATGFNETVTTGEKQQ